MKAPRIPPSKDSLAATAAAEPFAFSNPLVSDPAAALEEAISRLIDAESTLRLIGDCVFNIAPSDPDASKAFSATEVLCREMKAIGALLDGTFSALNDREGARA